MIDYLFLGNAKSPRRARFHDAVAGVDEQRFQSSWFLSYYKQTDRCPTNDEIVSSLLDLQVVNSSQHPVLELIRMEDPEYNVLKVYTSSESFGSKAFYNYINEQLRIDDKDTIRKLMPFIRRATYQINNKGPTQNCVVYRGMNLSRNDQNFFTTNKVFRFQGFTSTSSKKWLASTFGDTLFKIEIDAGCQQVRNVADISYYTGEHEWLFSPYSRFRVQGKHYGVIRLKALDNMV